MNNTNTYCKMQKYIRLSFRHFVLHNFSQLQICMQAQPSVKLIRLTGMSNVCERRVFVPVQGFSFPDR